MEFSEKDPIRKCANCGNIYPAHASHCPQCGRANPCPRIVEEMRCPQCGAVYSTNYSRCTKCCTPLVSTLDKDAKKKLELLGTYICTKCGGTTKDPKEVGTGIGCGVWIALALLSAVFAIFVVIMWAAVVVVAVAWVASKSGRKKYVCPHCGQTDCLIPVTTPEGKRLFEKGNYVSDGDRGAIEQKSDSTNTSTSGIVGVLNKLKELKSQGLISEDEYNEKRKRVLDSL
ncbi:SHOCT domain-containing protein [Fibrobacter sp.]|uniref:SHOCT domain-containing protein n=1 Tax=Fibrobacter sp. TaxID=35828 RepID=UPI00388E307E